MPTATPSRRKAIPITEAIESIGVSVPTGYKLIAQGYLRTFVIGNRRYTTEAFVDQCIAQLADREEFSPTRIRTGRSGGKKTAVVVQP